jgi:stearoyl-CoA desaturase (delta-9 desaturase)
MDDQSRNNFLFGVLGFAKGWHNNHHAFPTSARFGLRWWQIDLGYSLISVLALFGLASKVRHSGNARVDPQDPLHQVMSLIGASGAHSPKSRSS